MIILARCYYQELREKRSCKREKRESQTAEIRSIGERINDQHYQGLSEVYCWGLRNDNRATHCCWRVRKRQNLWPTRSS